MGAIGVKKAAAVRSPLFNNFLRRYRTLRDRLLDDGIHHWLTIPADNRLSVIPDLLNLHWLNQGGLVIRPEILHYSLRNKQQRAKHAKRQQNPKAGARHINPKVPDGRHLPPRDAPNKSDRQSNAHSRRNKIVVCESRHLSEITHGRLTRIRLPVGVRGERCSRVKSQMRGTYSSELLRIKGQETLYSLHYVQHNH